MVLNLNWLGVSGRAGLCCVFRTEAPVESHAATLARTSSNTPDPCMFCLNQVLAIAHAETPRGAQFFTIPICSYVELSGVTSHSLSSWELGKRAAAWTQRSRQDQRVQKWRWEMTSRIYWSRKPGKRQRGEGQGRSTADSSE